MAISGLSVQPYGYQSFTHTDFCVNIQQLPYFRQPSGSKFGHSLVQITEDMCNVNIRRKSRQILYSIVQASDSERSILTVPPADQSSLTPLRQEIDFQVANITKNILSLRGKSFERLKFEVEYGMKRGTTDNSYIVKGANGMVLIDVPDPVFKEKFVEVLEKTVDLRSLTYVILGHLSPKRVESLIALCERDVMKSSPVQVYCSNPAAQILLASLPESLKDMLIVKIVRAGDYLDLGEGYKLTFILTPTPRWPDGMCTYDQATQLLFTHKLFSAHVCADNYLDVGGWDVYGEDWQFFYDCMISPAPQQAAAALERLPIVAQFSRPNYVGKTGIELVKADVRYILSSIVSALKLPSINMTTGLTDNLSSEGFLITAAICPMHGPVVRSSLTEIVREYRAWTKQRLQQIEEATVAVIYASAYGNTAALAQAISRGISKAGVGVESLNAEQSSSDEVAALLQRCSGFVIGSPTLGGHMPTPVQNALGVILKDNDARSKPCGVFGSFGWSGEAVDEIEQRLKDGGFSFAFPTIRCKFKPTESMLQICDESGTDLAQTVKRMLLKRRNRSTTQFVVASNVEQAVGRVIGSLCVLSAKDGDAESSMLASWVSQASFVPAGLTIAVAKDRAVESLVLPGGKFVLNVLGQGKSSAISKQLLKPFKPGEPRFEGLQTKDAKNGGQILLDAISWMECTVMSRMETGDHWVLYAKIEDGNIQDEKTPTAIHYRKSGARY